MAPFLVLTNVVLILGKCWVWTQVHIWVYRIVLIGYQSDEFFFENLGATSSKKWCINVIRLILFKVLQSLHGTKAWYYGSTFNMNFLVFWFITITYHEFMGAFFRYGG